MSFALSHLHVFWKSKKRGNLRYWAFKLICGTFSYDWLRNTVLLNKQKYLRLSWRDIVDDLPLVPCKIANTEKRKIFNEAKMVANVLTNFHDEFLPVNLESFACFDSLKNEIECTMDTSIKRNRYPKCIITNRSTGQYLKNSTIIQSLSCWDSSPLATSISNSFWRTFVESIFYC